MGDSIPGDNRGIPMGISQVRSLQTELLHLNPSAFPNCLRNTLLQSNPTISSESLGTPQETNNMSIIHTAITSLLSFQLFLGGQARITPLLTTTLYDRAHAKAEGYQKHLPFIPAQNPTEHSNIIGRLMYTAGAMLCFKITRTAGAALSTSLSLMGVYSHYRMGAPYWVSVVNTVLAVLIIAGET
jgi:hypothetical protein